MSEWPKPDGLARVQQRFWRAVTSPEPVDRSMAELCRDDPGMAPLTGWIQAADEAAAAHRLNVYANMYFFRLLDVLRDDYPQIVRLVGDDAFHNLITDYLLAFPSANPSIRHVGSHLAEFVAGHGLASAHPALASLAQLEWARGLAFDSPDGPILDAEQLTRVEAQDWPDLRFVVAPSFQQLTLDYPAQKLWQALERKEPPPALVAAETPILIWRKEFTVYHRGCSGEEAELLSMTHEQLSFAAICEHLYARRGEEAARIVVERLHVWLAQGLLSAIAA